MARVSGISLAVLAVLQLLSPASTLADCDEHSYHWVVPSGDWFAPENWEHEEVNPDPPPPCILVPGVPDSDDWAHISNGGTATISSPGACAASVDVTSSSGLSILGGSLTTNGLSLDWAGWAMQTNGTVDLEGLSLGGVPGSSGSYDLQGGYLNTSAVDHIGGDGDGIFTQSGGTFEAGMHLILGSGPDSQGEYYLHAGDLSADRITLGFEGTGAFTQYAGTVQTFANEGIGLGESANSSGTYEQLGGTTRANFLAVGGAIGSTGTYRLDDGAVLLAGYEVVGGGRGSFNHAGGTNTVDQGLTLGWHPDSEGTYQLSGDAELSAAFETIGFAGSGTFTQTGGTNRITTITGEGFLFLGDQPESDGTYTLSRGELRADWEAIGYRGSGSFTHSGGTNRTPNLTIANLVGSSGTYQLSAEAEVVVEGGLFVGFQGTGTFTQTGGSNEVAGDTWIGCESGSQGWYVHSGGRHTNTGDGVDAFVLGFDDGAAGTYELSGTAELSSVWEQVGHQGSGTFMQTGGTNTVAQSLYLGMEPGSDGTYQLTGAVLTVGGTVFVGQAGSGFFVMNGGTINGTGEDARMIVNGSTGDLTGPGTFNITVTYESEKLYGTNGDQSVDAALPPGGLTVGGSYDVEQLDPNDFAGGSVPCLLESSVFDVSFDGSFTGDFEIAIPYDEDEVAARGIGEYDLVVFRETGPGSYECIPILNRDTVDDRLIALSPDFAKHAIAVAGDLDGDGEVGLGDLAALLANYGESSDMTYQDGDIDADGDVDLEDLAALLAVYGTTCP